MDAWTYSAVFTMPQGGPLPEHKLAERYFKAAQHHLGHKSAAITLDRYGLLLI